MADLAPITQAMSATIIDGKAIAAEVRAEVAAGGRAARRPARPRHRARRRRPGVARSTSPTSSKADAPRSACAASTARLPQDAAHDEVEQVIRELNADPEVRGILLQLPTPPQVDGGALTTLIDPRKDVDGLTPVRAGLLAQGKPGLRPCTPSGCMELLRRHDVALEGAEAVVRRPLGPRRQADRPAAAGRQRHRHRLPLAARATSRRCAARADVLVAAVGRAEMVRGDWIKPGAAVIDVGINRTDDGLKGDVAFDEAVERAGLITPVPGGVGPMTIAMLLRNTLEAAKLQRREARR